MRRSILLVMAILLTPEAISDSTTFASRLCSSSKEYTCLTIKEGDTWENLWPDKEVVDILQRINRTNNKLKPGMVIAVPNHIEGVSIWNTSPFPRQIAKPGTKLIIVDQNILAWAVFDKDGELQWWGPISSGRDICSDSKHKCKTVTGKYYIFDKKMEDCQSTVFPIGVGGAQMPYCMYFYRGFALHGSDNVPGYRDSHGCVRLFTEDAKWLNEQFIDLPTKGNQFQGTTVIIRELKDQENPTSS